MKRLILHIGTHKTGTTSLQEFLNDNREALAGQGIHYAPSEFKHKGISLLRNGHFLVRYAKSIIDPSCHTPERARATSGNIESLRKVLAENDTVLLTDERLWFQGAAYRESWGLIRELFDELGVDQVRFIVYFRRQDQFISSLWNQFVKGKTRLRSSLVDYANRDVSRKAMDYYAGLKIIEDVFGRGCVDVHVYERRLLVDGDIRVDFCNALGVDPGVFTFGESESNPGLSAGVAEVKREANRVAAYRKTDNFLCEPAVAVSPLSSGESKVLTFELSERILEPYRDGNERIARSYLHRDDGVLFAPVARDDGKPGASFSDEYMRDTVRFFTAALAQEHAARLELEKRVSSLEDDIRKLRSQGNGHNGLLEKIRRRP